MQSGTITQQGRDRIARSVSEKNLYWERGMGASPSEADFVRALDHELRWQGGAGLTEQEIDQIADSLYEASSAGIINEPWPISVANFMIEALRRLEQGEALYA